MRVSFEIFDEESYADGQHQSDDDGQRRVERRARLGGLARRLSPLEYQNGVGRLRFSHPHGRVALPEAGVGLGRLHKLNLQAGEIRLITYFTLRGL